MPRAVRKGVVIARSDRTEGLEGNACHPPSAPHPAPCRPASRTTVGGWKGTARDPGVAVDGKVNPAAPWHPADAKPAAAIIGAQVAFRQGIAVEP